MLRRVQSHFRFPVSVKPHWLAWTTLIFLHSLSTELVAENRPQAIPPPQGLPPRMAQSPQQVIPPRGVDPGTRPPTAASAESTKPVPQGKAPKNAKGNPNPPKTPATGSSVPPIPGGDGELSALKEFTDLIDSSKEKEVFDRMALATLIDREPVGSIFPFESPEFDKQKSDLGTKIVIGEEEAKPREIAAHTAPSGVTGLPLVSEVSIILSNDQFIPAQVRIREGLETKLIFTTVNTTPAALIIEPLKVQKWIGAQSTAERTVASESEYMRELKADKITEITLQEPKKGIYVFHDALSGAKGEIIVVVEP